MPIFRVFAPAGRFRVEVPSDASLKTLYKEIAVACGVDKSQSFVLYREPNFRRHVKHTGQIFLNSPEADLPNGQVLYLKFTSEEGARIAEETMERVAATHVERPLLPEEPEEVDLKNMKFQSFDFYLKNKLNYDTTSLPLNLCFGSKMLRRGCANSLPPTITLKHQCYRAVDHVEFQNAKEMSGFVGYWRGDLGCQLQRCAWLIGYYREDSHYPLGVRAVVEALYEPPQECIDQQPIMLEDSNFDNVRAVASALGLEVVGWIFTHSKRDPALFLTSQECIRIAQLQLQHSTTNHYSGYRVSPFVTVTMSLGEDGNPATNAFIVSDLGMALVRDGLALPEQKMPNRIVLRPPKKDELNPAFLENGKIVEAFDVEWVIVRLNDTAPVHPQSIFSSWSFPPQNRLIEPQISDLSDYIRSRPDKTAHSSYADWHLLLFILKLFDAATAIEVAKHIIDETPIDQSFAETLLLI